MFLHYVTHVQVIYERESFLSVSASEIQKHFYQPVIGVQTGDGPTSTHAHIHRINKDLERKLQWQPISGVSE